MIVLLSVVPFIHQYCFVVNRRVLNISHVEMPFHDLVSQKVSSRITTQKVVLICVFKKVSPST